MATASAALEGAGQEILKPPSAAQRRFDAEFAFSRDAAHLILPRATVDDEDRHALRAHLVQLEEKVQVRGGKIGFRENFDGGAGPLPYDLPRWGANPALDAMIDDARNTHTEYLRIGVLKNDALETATLIMRRSHGQKTRFAWIYPGEKFASGANKPDEDRLQPDPIRRPETIRGTMDHAFAGVEQYVTRSLAVLRMPEPAALSAPDVPEPKPQAPVFIFPFAS